MQAKLPDDAPPASQRLMLQKLLTDRFKLRARRETRMTPMYALTVMRKGRLGPDLKFEPRTAPYEMLVIDSVDWPTPD